MIDGHQEQPTPSRAAAVDGEHPGDAVTRNPAPAKRWNAILLRVVVYGTLVAAVLIGGLELWAQKSYHATVAALGELQDSSDSFPSLERAEDSVKGWVARPFKREDKGFQEEITIRWRSIFGDYWVRLKSIRKRKTRERLFAGFVTRGETVSKASAPSSFSPLPKKPPAGGTDGAGRRKRPGLSPPVN